MRPDEFLVDEVDYLSVDTDATTAHGPDIDADDYNSDDSPSLHSTQSLRDSLIAVIEENGRLYNGYGHYILPNDESERERLSLQFETLTALFGGRAHFAPIRNPRKIKDIGSGPGYWCLKMGNLYPRARVEGTDIDATSFLPKTPQMPNNVEWVHEDALDPRGSSQRYDYIHTASMLGSFEDFRVVIKKSFDQLEPGGYMESVEMWSKPLCVDNTMPDDNMFVKYSNDLDEALMRMGRPLRIANKLKRWYRDAGFVDVVEERFKIPLNGWPRDPKLKLLGKCWGKSVHDGLQGFALRPFTTEFGWTRNEVEVYLPKVRSALLDRRVHAYHDIYVVYGRKPHAHHESRSPSNGRTTPTPRDPYRSSSSPSTAANSSGSTEPPVRQPRPNHPNANGRTSSSSNRRPNNAFSSHPHGRQYPPQ